MRLSDSASYSTKAFTSEMHKHHEWTWREISLRLFPYPVAFVVIPTIHNSPPNNSSSSPAREYQHKRLLSFAPLDLVRKRRCGSQSEKWSLHLQAGPAKQCCFVVRRGELITVGSSTLVCRTNPSAGETPKSEFLYLTVSKFDRR